MDRDVDLVNISDGRQVRGEIIEVEGRIRTELEKIMMERPMPTVKIKKGSVRSLRLSKGMHDRGKVNPDQWIELHPVPHEKDRDWWKIMDWELKKEDADKTGNKHVGMEKIDMKEWDKYSRGLPRNYGKPKDGETAFLFKNRAGDMVGWCTGYEDGSKNYSIRYIGVVDGLEGQGYGGGMFDELKGEYKTLVLSADAYAKHGGRNREQERLLGFYARNGFRFTSSGLGWSKSMANFEDTKPGAVVKFSDEVVVSGDNISSEWIMREYFSELDKQGKLEETMGEKGADAARNWMKITQEQDRFYSSGS